MVEGMVSCVIPTYRRSDSLIRAINSVLNQTYKNIEVIVVDDNNPNDEFSVIVQGRLKTITDKRVRYIQQEKHINGAAARNMGVKLAKGEYIAFLDDDDEWLKFKLESQIKLLKNMPGFDGVSCLYKIFSDGKEVRKCPKYTGENLHKKIIERSVAVYTSTVVFKKESLDKSGYFDETMIRHQDLQLLLDFLAINKMVVESDYHVILHTDIGGNRPTASQLVEIKSYFFERMKEHFNKYDDKTKKRILAGHYFEVILLALREKNLRISFRYLLKVGVDPIAYFDLFKRFLGRKKK